MNNKIKNIICAMFLVNIYLVAYADEDYLRKFQTYQQYSENIPNTIDDDFINFIKIPSPLTNKLRDKLLYKLAANKDWQNYNKYYRISTNSELQCHAATARIKLNENKEQVLKDIMPLWLNGESQPDACDYIFNILLDEQKTKNKLINQRVAKALEKNNVALSLYLLKKSSPPQNNQITLLNIIHKNPNKISKLKSGDLQGDFYLYGLKKLVRQHPEKAMYLFKNPRAKMIMNNEQQQNFLAYFALYRAIRNKNDALYWFSKVDKKFYSNTLANWEITYSIANKNWQHLLHIIDKSEEKESSRLKYWQARAYESIGNKIRSKEIYAKISHQRNYYGFLASTKLNKKISIVNEKVIPNKEILMVYKPVLDKIKDLHDKKQIFKASRMINDFSSELGKTELSSFAYWVAKELKWNGKSIYLCNNEDLFNKLTLRFPLTYKNIIYQNATKFNIPVPLIYAIIRQESAFFEEIQSSAGARGLMQLMPNTAKLVAKKTKTTYKNALELNTPYKNIHLGTAYLKQLSNMFNDNLILIIAAYNAGPRQVTSWIKNNPKQDMDIWIETIPWAETRNYVKNVISFYAVYQYRLYNKYTLAEFTEYFK